MVERLTNQILLQNFRNQVPSNFLIFSKLGLATFLNKFYFKQLPKKESEFNKILGILVEELIKKGDKVFNVVVV